MRSTIILSILAFVFSLVARQALAASMEDKMSIGAQAVLKTLSDEANMKLIHAAIRESMTHHGETSRLSKKAPKSIVKMDKKWRKWLKKFKKDPTVKGPEWIEKVAANGCSLALKKLQAEGKNIGEIFVMDSVGATACFSAPTSDYDQGDEDKWQEPFVNGVKIHQGELEKDLSSGVALIQFSYPLLDKGKKIGVVTIGITN